MYLQFNKSKGKNGKIYKSVLLCEKYRDNETGVPKTKVVLNLSKLGLSDKVITNLKTAINKTKGVLIDSQDIKINKTFDYGFIHLILTQIANYQNINCQSKIINHNSKILIPEIIILHYFLYLCKYETKTSSRTTRIFGSNR